MGASNSKTPSQTTVAPKSIPSTTTTTTTTTTPPKIARTRTARRPRSQTDQKKESNASFYLQQPLDIVVLGASGDLAKKKTYPSLYELFANAFLPPNCRIWGYARSNYAIEDFHARIRPYLEKSNNADADKITAFLSICVYHQGTGYDDVPSWDALSIKIATTAGSNRLFYFALPTGQFGPAGKAIATAKGMMVEETGDTNENWNRFVIEKPFGRDTETSEALAQELTSLFQEHQLYRIDHYLGKGMVQNILSLRLNNIFFSKLWNRESVASVTISWKENIGTMGRGGYFDSSGIMRDVMQNHLLQVLSIVAMEEPVTMTATDIRNAKTKALSCISPLKVDDVILGQYTSGMIPGAKEQEPGYREDPTVPNDSIAATYCLAKFTIDNDRWKNVPFVMKAGKAMDSKLCTVRIQFKPESPDVPPNELVIRIQPDPAIWMNMNVMEPGLGNHLMQTHLDLTYSKHSELKGKAINAYTRLLLDVLRGDQSTFVRSDELSQAWRIFTPVLHAIDDEKIAPTMYPAGTRGPPAADAYMATVRQRSKEYVWKTEE